MLSNWQLRERFQRYTTSNSSPNTTQRKQFSNYSSSSSSSVVDIDDDSSEFSESSSRRFSSDSAVTDGEGSEMCASTLVVVLSRFAAFDSEDDVHFSSPSSSNIDQTMIPTTSSLSEDDLEDDDEVVIDIDDNVSMEPNFHSPYRMDTIFEDSSSESSSESSPTNVIPRHVQFSNENETIFEYPSVSSFGVWQSELFWTDDEFGSFRQSVIYDLRKHGIYTWRSLRTALNMMYEKDHCEDYTYENSISHQPHPLRDTTSSIKQSFVGDTMGRNVSLSSSHFSYKSPVSRCSSYTSYVMRSPSTIQIPNQPLTR